MDLKEPQSSPISLPSIGTNNEIDKNSSSSSSGSSNEVNSFVSGEEECEPVSNNPVAEALIVEEKLGDPIDGTFDNSVPIVESSKKLDTLVNDDVENINKFDELETGKLSEGVGVEVEGGLKEPIGIEEVGGDDGGNEKVKFSSVVPEVTVTDGLVNDSKVFVASENDGGDKTASLDDRSEGSGVVDREVEEIKVYGGEESREVESSKSEIIATLKNDEQVAEIAKESEVDGINVNGVVGSGEVEKVEAPKGEVMGTLPDAEKVSEKSEVIESKLVKEHDTGLTSEGDSIIESIKVDVPSSQTGVVIVGEVKDESMPSKEIDVSAYDTIGLVNGNSESSEVVEEVFSNGVADANDKTSEPTPEDDTEASESTVAVTGNDDHIIQENVVDDSDGKGSVLGSNNTKRNMELGIDQEELSEVKENGTMNGAVVDAVPKASDAETLNLEKEISHGSEAELENMVFDESHQQQYTQGESIVRQEEILPEEEKLKNQIDGDSEQPISDEEIEHIFGNSEAAKQFVEDLEQGSGSDMHSGAGSYGDNSQKIDGQIVTDSEEEEDTDEEGDGREMFDSAALAALLKAATGSESDGGNITINSQDRSRIFSVERPAGLGTSIRSLRPAPRPTHSSIYNPITALSGSTESENNISEEEKKKLEKLQGIRVKFLRLIQRLGLSTDEPIAAQVLYRLALVAGRQSSQLFSIDAAKSMAVQLEEEGKDDLDFSLNIMVIGKCGVGKSATINSIIGEDKSRIDAFEAATTSVKVISGYVDGVKIRVLDTPGLKSSVMEQAFNTKVLSSVKKLTKKSPVDIVLYVDRLDAATRDLNDLPLMKTITSSLGTSIWRSTIVTLTHAASAPPDGPSGSPLSYEVFVTQRSHVVQQSIGQAVSDVRMMSPSAMNPVSLVENHPSCRKNREGQKILPNGQSWKPQLLLLCYSMKILSEANSISKPQDPFDHRKLFGFRARSPPLPYMLSSMLQNHPHPKLSTDQDNVDSDIDLDELSDIDDEEEDEYDQLPPFKPLKKAQLARLSSEQKKAYFEEYDYRVKLLQKKQWKEELRRMRQAKKGGKDAATDYGYAEEDADAGAAAPVAVPLPDMALPPSFDSDNPAHRYRFLEPTSQFLARPVLDTHGWDHDCGYDGVNFEHNLAIASRFPATYTIQVTKDKKDFTINVDSAVSAKHGENGSSMAGFDVQSIGKQLAYIIRGEYKFKNMTRNKTTGGISVTFLGENVVPGIKVEDQLILGKQYALTGSAGAVRSQSDTAYGANFELHRREQDYPIGQVQSTFSMSIIKWRGDLALGFNTLAQFSLGRSSKVTVRAGLNNKLSGQISVKTSSSEHMSLALAAVLPTALAIYRKFYPEVTESYMY
ncbi:hypothetical protein Leryth_000147 [Lithospermum erythrorhizon]|nr:hypothetical protein Leryth_000147 [Lithospermum erythrorhizon]